MHAAVIRIILFDCRIITHEDLTGHVVPGSARVVHFDKEFGLDPIKASLYSYILSHANYCNNANHIHITLLYTD